MVTFLIIFILFICVMAAMAIGVMCGHRPIQGSCGGLNNVGVERACGCTDVCKNDASVRLDNTESQIGIYKP